ncbi:HAMP domain-containing methyl-accepting chemotaxis protein [Lysinibacillus telephonicus]|uniref:methyl-accepting chemotaxis protein n=1 Tax=Lysinibacillus telephonicus TaxID=1714840 RepID=UPI00397D0A57
MKMTIRKKMLSGFMILTVLLGAICALSYYEIQKVNHSYSDLVEQLDTNLINIKDIQLYASREIASLRGILAGDEGSIEFLQTTIEQLEEKVTSEKTVIQGQEANELLITISDLHEQLKEKSLNVINSKEVNNEQVNQLVNEEIIPIAAQIEEAANKMVEIQTKEMQEGITVNSDMVDSVKNINLFWGLISSALAIFISVLMSRMITRPILFLVEGARNIALGDLTHDDIKVKNHDEIGELAHVFNEMKQNLRQLIHQVHLNSERVAFTSDELSASAEDTNRATEQISFAMQEIAMGAEKQVSMVIQAAEASEEISKGMSKAADSIQSVANLTVAANNNAAIGNEVVKRTLEQMNQVHDSARESAQVVHTLSEKSEEIGKIIELITQVADQTNLLALNAAIEAARAGEQGKGFTVVADEVRKLANQSSTAAEQIRSLIKDIQDESQKAVKSINSSTQVVKEGLNMVRKTGDSFQDIDQSIKQVAVESQEVAAIVKQVHSNLKKVDNGMQEVRYIVEESTAKIQNAAASTEEQNSTMKEVSSSAEVLSEMAQELQKIISSFKS